VGLSGPVDLPAAQALAGARRASLARAGQYEASGAFSRAEQLAAWQALAYLHLLNGVSAGDAIRVSPAPPPRKPPGGGPLTTAALTTAALTTAGLDDR